jgi:quercetin dioxygenase-like cupin family protein
MATDRNPAAEIEGVVALADLVQHQPGAVISRTIIKKPTGTVTAFAFDAGEGLSEHTAAYDALVVGVEGEATITIAGNPFKFSAGHVLRLPAGKPHALSAVSPFKMLLVMIRE